MNNQKKKHMPSRLAISTAVATAMLTGYSGRNAYAGDCATITGPGTYTCSGAADPVNDTTQTRNPGMPLEVTTTPGFGIDTAVGDALELEGDGGLIFIDNYASTIKTRDPGDHRGIDAVNNNSGALTITSTGTVESVGDDGIYAYNKNGTTDLTIKAATVKGGDEGIQGYNYGSGYLSITSTGTVEAGENGIFGWIKGSDLSITANGAVVGGLDGIYAYNEGTGTLSITSTGTVVGGEKGIYAYNGTGTTDLTINTAAVTGFDDGIQAWNNGSGNLSISSSGAVVGGDRGIFAENGTGTNNLTITTAAVTGSTDGIFARNNGPGTLSITTSGTVEAGEVGIFGWNSGLNLSITANGAVVGGHTGIWGRNIGSGTLSITSTGTVVGGDFGIYAYNRTGTTDLTINAAAVRGANGGIFALNNGSGTLSITSSGTVVGGGNGIWAYNGNGTTDLTINTAAVTGAYDGIQAENYGSGNLSISSSGAVVGGDRGVYAKNGTGTNNLTINTAAVTGSTEGIHAINEGTGSITITHSGAVTGTTGIKVDGRTNNSPATINSYAPITGTGGFAIDLRGDGHDVVNIGVGSVITGAIDFGDGNDGMGGTNANDIDTLNIDPGLNIVIHFKDASGTDSDLESAPEIVSSNIAFINGGTTAVATPPVVDPPVVDPPVAVVVDPSGFTASGLFLGSFTRAIHNSIDSGGVTSSNGNASNSFTGLQANGLSQRHWVSGLGGRQEIKSAGNSGASGISANGVASPYALDLGSIFWVSVFGGHQEVDAADNNADLDHDFAGLMTGAESSLNNGTLGLFGGYGTSDVEIAYEAGSTETEALFGGVYWKKDYDTYRVNLMLIAGLTDHEFRREITGATPGTAKGETDGWFISPSATFTVPITALPVTTLGSIRLSYAGMFMDDYTETGVANPLTVFDRDVQLFNTRAQLAFPHDFNSDDGVNTHLEVRAGVDAQYDLDSDEVTGVVSSSPINFSVYLDDRVSGFIGATWIRSSEEQNLIFAISGEVQSDFDDSHDAVIEFSVARRF